MRQDLTETMHAIANANLAAAKTLENQLQHPQGNHSEIDKGLRRMRERSLRNVLSAVDFLLESEYH